MWYFRIVWFVSTAKRLGMRRSPGGFARDLDLCQMAAIMPAGWRAATVLVCLAAVLSGGVCGSDKGLSNGERHNDDACLASSEVLDTSLGSRTIEVPHPGKPDARYQRRRRVGFSHEDVSADESLRPFLAAFRSALSGNANDAVGSAEMYSESSSDSDTSTRADGHEAAAYSSRRYLAAVDPVEEPSFYPNGGTYHHPIAVSLVSSDGSIIFYTIDGTSPDESSAFVVSGEIVVVEDSATLRAKAVYKNLLFSSYSSAETEASFVVYSTGKCGHAYFVPHFTSSGYSGNVVEVDLQTDVLGSVRLHGVVTDFADFYATGGVGPYDGQVVTKDLTADGDDDLAGYWGGFSGDVDGVALGFLSPFFNGNDFHGKAVQVRLSNFGGANITRLCGSEGVQASNTTCLFTVLDLEGVDLDLRGFSGGFLDDSKAYFVPSHNGRGSGAKFVRVDAGNFSRGSVEILDLQSVDSEVGGFFGGFAWEGYGFLVPSRSFQGPVGGVNTMLSADGFSWSSSFVGDDNSRSHRKAGRLQPAYSGKLVRVDLAEFSPSGVEVLDLTMVDPDLKGFMGGFSAGHWGFLVPFKNRETDGEFSGKLVRVDLRTFDHAGVTVLDLTRVDGSLRGFVGGFTHGRYAILSPYSNGNTTGNYRGRSQFGQMVAVDLDNFGVEGVSVVDLATTSRQQIPYQPDPNLRGYVGGFSLGQHVYLTPHFNGVFFGKVVRVDMREILAMAAGERATSYDGLQVLDLELDSSEAVGFSGAFHSWDTSCY